jgi:hypothetical protein
MSWRFVRCESWPCSDYENDRNMWLYAMEIARDPKQSEIIRIRTYRNSGNRVAELHRQVMGTVGDKPAPYFLGMRCDIMKRQVKQFFAAWIKVK